MRVATSKSGDEEPVPSVWRKPLVDVVDAFRRGDFCLKEKIAGVGPISQNIADSIANNLNSYGAELMALPEKTWKTSVSRWMGPNWEVIVDLFTVDEGVSDLAMFANVIEIENSFLIEIDSVHVP